MTPEQLSDVFVAALTDLVSAGVVDLPDGVPSQVLVERPKVKEHGDYATNVALQLGKRAGLNPRDLATQLAERLTEHPGIASVDVAGPGFLNVRVAAGAQGVLAADVVRAGESYGTSAVNAGRNINLEFISANPTGPLHLGHPDGPRSATRSRVSWRPPARPSPASSTSTTAAPRWTRRATLMARAHDQEPPEDGYHGAYVNELAERVVAHSPIVLEKPATSRVRFSATSASSWSWPSRRPS